MTFHVHLSETTGKEVGSWGFMVDQACYYFAAETQHYINNQNTPEMQKCFGLAVRCLEEGDDTVQEAIRELYLPLLNLNR